MRFFFCEACGKRVTDDELPESAAQEPSAQAVYCKACAAARPPAGARAGAAREAHAAPAKHATPGGGTGGHRRVATAGPPAAPDALKARRGSGQAEGAAAAGSSKMVVFAVGGIVVGVLLAVGIALALRGNAPERRADKPAASGSGPAGGSRTEQPAPKAGGGSRTETPPVAPPTPPVSSPTPPAALDAAAEQAAFDQFLAKVRALPDTDLAGRIALARGYIESHKDPLLSARARVMLSDWQKAADESRAKTQPPPAPDAPAPPAGDAAERLVIWNGDDKTPGKNWAVSQDKSAKLAVVVEGTGNTNALRFDAGGGGYAGFGWNWCCWSPANGGTDASAYQSVSLQLRVRLDGAKPAWMNISLRSSSNKDYTGGVSLIQREPNLFDGNWHRIVVPLKDFSDCHPTKLWEVKIDCYRNAPAPITIWMDDLGFETRR